MAQRNSAKPSPFEKRYVEESAKADTTTLMEHLNLPPGFIEFVEKNKRTIWIVIAILCCVTVAWTLYDSYTQNRRNKAASALTRALMAEPDAREQALVGVAEEFGGTPAALWSKIELAQLAKEKGDYAKAISVFLAVREKISAKSPLMPLVVAGLAAASEKSGDQDKALAYYEELAALEGFAPTASLEMARIYEEQGKKDKAIEKYELFLSESGMEGESAPGVDPTAEFVRARLNRLRE